MRISPCARPLTLQNLLRKVNAAQHVRLVAASSAWYKVPDWIVAPNNVRHSPVCAPVTFASMGVFGDNHCFVAFALSVDGQVSFFPPDFQPCLGLRGSAELRQHGVQPLGIPVDHRSVVCPS